MFRSMFLALALLFTASPALAEKTAKPWRAGVVNIQTVILSVDQGREANAKIQGDFNAKRSEFQKREEELQKEHAALKGQTALLSKDAAAKKTQAFGEKQEAFKRDQMEFLNAIKLRERQATQEIANRAESIVHELRARHDLDVVLAAGGLVSARVQPMDLTDDVVKIFNERHPASSKKSKPKS